MRKRLVLAASLAQILLAAGSLAQSAPAGGQKTGPDPERLNVLAHRVLDAAVKANGLSGPGVKPWHLKLDFQMVVDSSSPKPTKGTMEEWYAGPYRWRRTFASVDPRLSGSQWSVSRFERYTRKDQHEDFLDYSMTLRVARPVVDPLYQVENVKPSDKLQVARVTTGGIPLNCVSFAEPTAEEHGKKPEWSFPTMCFDSDLHLRLVHSEETSVQFEDIQTFQGRGIAHDVKILFQGQLRTEMTVTQLESAGDVDEAVLKPATDAVAKPYVIEPGMPKPVSVFETGAIIPLTAQGKPFRGTLLVPVTIHKDGTVKINRAAGASFMQAIFDAAYLAVAKWKFQPYTVDGEVVEADYDVPYVVDGKPFVPSYQRPHTATDGIAGGHPDP